MASVTLLCPKFYGKHIIIHIPRWLGNLKKTYLCAFGCRCLNGWVKHWHFNFNIPTLLHSYNSSRMQLNKEEIRNLWFSVTLTSNTNSTIWIDSKPIVWDSYIPTFDIQEIVWYTLSTLIIFMKHAYESSQSLVFKSRLRQMLVLNYILLNQSWRW